MKVTHLHRDRKPRGESRQAANDDHRDGAPRERGSQAGTGERVKDARPGREFQGIGVLNKAGRFGSSTRPEELGGSPDAGAGEEGADGNGAGET
jgi:hypothetical protein